MTRSSSSSGSAIRSSCSNQIKGTAMGRLLRGMWCRPDDGGDAPLISRITAFAGVFLLVAALFWFAFSQLQYGWNWRAVWQYRQKFLQGWLTTVLISSAALSLTLLISVFAALALPGDAVYRRSARDAAAGADPGLLLRGGGRFRRQQSLCGRDPDAGPLRRGLSERDHPGRHRERRRVGTGIGARHRPDIRPDLPLRHIPAGGEADSPADGRPVRLADQGFLAAV